MTVLLILTNMNSCVKNPTQAVWLCSIVVMNVYTSYLLCFDLKISLCVTFASFCSQYFCLEVMKNDLISIDPSNEVIGEYANELVVNNQLNMMVVDIMAIGLVYYYDSKRTALLKEL